MEIELSALIRALRKLFWVPLIFIVALAFVGHQAVERQEKTYTAKSTLVIEQPTSSGGSGSQAGTAKSIVDTYTLLLETDEFQQTVSDVAEVDSLDDYTITLSAASGSNQVEIRVSHSDPNAAMNVSNATVDALVENYHLRSRQRLDQTTSDLNTQLQDMRSTRDALDQEVRAMEDAESPDVSQIRNLSDQVSRLNNQIAETEVRIDKLKLDFQLAEPNLVPIKSSTPPKTPDNISPILGALVGATLGALIGSAVLVGRAALNDVVHSANAWQRETGRSVIGQIPRATSLTKGANQVFILAEPTAAPAESIRMLVASLDFRGFPSSTHRVLQVTGPGSENGKSTTSSNLAVHFAQLGKRVVLIDCDLHRPTLHSVFSIQREPGLSNLLMDRNLGVEDVAKRVALPGLEVITSGSLPPNPVELFSSVQFANLITQLKAAYDVIILDTPPILLFSDSQRIATHSDGVIAVGRIDRTKKPDMEQAVDVITSTGGNFLGAVWVGTTETRDHRYYRRRKRTIFRR